MSLETIQAILLLLSWLDYLLIISYFSLLVYNIRVGAGRVGLNLLWLIIFLAIANIAYQPMMNTWSFQWLVIWFNQTTGYQVISAFSMILIGLYGLRILIYRLIKASVIIHNPCWFNSLLFWPIILSMIYLGLSSDKVIGFINDLLNITIKPYDYFYFGLYFGLLMVVFLIVKLFNINLYQSPKCLLQALYLRLLQALHAMAYFLIQKSKLSLGNGLIAWFISSLYFMVLIHLGLLFLDQSKLIDTQQLDSHLLPYLSTIVKQFTPYLF